MKKTLLALSLTLILSAFVIQATTQRSAATVEQREGIYVFICSAPVAKYETVGSIKKGFAATGAPGEMLNAMVKKCKKDHPTAQAIIFTSASMDKADCIKFKE